MCNARFALKVHRYNSRVKAVLKEEVNADDAMEELQVVAATQVQM